MMAHSRGWVYFALVKPDEDCLIPDAWESIPTFDRITLTTDSEEAFAKATEWIEECLLPDGPGQSPTKTLRPH